MTWMIFTGEEIMRALAVAMRTVVRANLPVKSILEETWSMGVAICEAWKDRRRTVEGLLDYECTGLREVRAREG